MVPPENLVDGKVLSPLLTGDYYSNDESDEEDDNIDTSTQQFWGVVHPESMPQFFRNVYNLLPRKQTDYVK